MVHDGVHVCVDHESCTEDVIAQFLASISVPVCISHVSASHSDSHVCCDPPDTVHGDDDEAPKKRPGKGRGSALGGAGRATEVRPKLLVVSEVPVATQSPMDSDDTQWTVVVANTFLCAAPAMFPATVARALSAPARLARSKMTDGAAQWPADQRPRPPEVCPEPEDSLKPQLALCEAKVQATRELLAVNSLSAALLPETFPLRHLHGESLLGDGAVGLGGDLLDASVGVAPNVERVRGLLSNGAEHGEGETAAQESLPEHTADTGSDLRAVSSCSSLWQGRKNKGKAKALVLQLAETRKREALKLEAVNSRRSAETEASEVDGSTELFAQAISDELSRLFQEAERSALSPEDTIRAIEAALVAASLPCGFLEKARGALAAFAALDAAEQVAAKQAADEQTVVEQDAAKQAAAKYSRRSAVKSPPKPAAGFFELPRPPEDEATAGR